jgi:hypothetical protein
MTQPPFPQAPGPNGQPPQPPQPPAGPPPPYYQAAPPPAAPLSPEQDAEANKVWGILAYIIFLIPLFAAPKESRFARFHTNQGLVLAIAGIAYGVVSSVILSVVVGAAYTRSFGSGIGTAGVLGGLFTLLWFVYAAFAIIGIVNAANGKTKPLPGIGSITLLK